MSPRAPRPLSRQGGFAFRYARLLFVLSASGVFTARVRSVCRESALHVSEPLALGRPRLPPPASGTRCLQAGDAGWPSGRGARAAAAESRGAREGGRPGGEDG